ncbi:alpha/beta-glucosidase agdC [Apiospora saccharicola]|uniref:Probable alpha/beta-glucosidase agdC n=1 Tax=Apiospora saccharicola TaxID=335842 RepID=A0ABR1WJE6_9PEZI
MPSPKQLTALTLSFIAVYAANPDECSGYTASDVVEGPSSFQAELRLNKPPGCSIFGPDLPQLRLRVEYQTGKYTSVFSYTTAQDYAYAYMCRMSESRLRVLIRATGDVDDKRSSVPEHVLPLPESDTSISREDSLLSFSYAADPFSFQVTRKATSDILFDTAGSPLVFEPQYIRIQSQLPSGPNLYGLGEHMDGFRLPFGDNYTRTMWNRDSDGVPYGENLYGSHPVYFEHRGSGGGDSNGGTHGVFLRNCHGADIKPNEDSSNDGGDNDKYSIEYILTGGDLDFFFLAGPSPVEVSRQYALVVGTPAMIPYWSLGVSFYPFPNLLRLQNQTYQNHLFRQFHQCKFGYQDWFDVAEVISNYSASGIPLETMWTDIDYMDHRRVFSLDQERFPLERMWGIVRHLHDHQQRYMLMVNPAVADWPYPAFERGVELDVFLKRAHTHNDHENEYYRGVVWPGVPVFPDWLHPNASIYWDEQISDAFNPETGVDIGGIWIDMNEPASMCRYPCLDPAAEARRIGVPPDPPPLREPPRALPGFNTSGVEHPSYTFDNPYPQETVVDFETDDGLQHILGPRSRDDQEDLLEPPYSIHNGGPSGKISDLTVPTNIVHANGMREYDMHNLYGMMMGIATRQSMLKRRPGLKPFIITRSTFAGAGRHVQKWLGDNASRWDHYRSSIAGLLGFASVFQIPMVGSDVCGFKPSPSEKLCARWTTLGAFSPFFRNHAHDEAPPQKLYRSPLVASAAKHAIDLRYRLLDYLYTALQKQSHDGTPAINPLWFMYPDDPNTYAIDHQYLFGPCILVSPVTAEDATDVTIYLPDDVFYELGTPDNAAVHGKGASALLHDIPFDRIPLHVRGGCVVPMRVESANTTAELRNKGFELLVAPGLLSRGNGSSDSGGGGGAAAEAVAAEGELYVDDGVSLDGGANKLGLHFRYYDDEEGGGGIVEITEVAGRFVGAQQQHERRDGKSLQALMEEVGIQLDRVVVLGAGQGDTSSPRVVFK